MTTKFLGHLDVSMQEEQALRKIWKERDEIQKRLESMWGTITAETIHAGTITRCDRGHCHDAPGCTDENMPCTHPFGMDCTTCKPEISLR